MGRSVPARRPSFRLYRELKEYAPVILHMFRKAPAGREQLGQLLGRPAATSGEVENRVSSSMLAWANLTKGWV